MGRWSRLLARELVAWLRVPAGASWLEIGCGTGSLTSAICELAEPASVVACDTAPDFVSYCREHLRYPQLSVVAATPGQLPAPLDSAGFDAVASSLVLNFLPDPAEALAQMRTACVPGGCVGACVWDYADGMEFLRIFWDAAVDLDPAARSLHEGFRFPVCKPDTLREAFEAAGFETADVSALTIPTTFSSFDDFWAPFVDGPGPAPTYVSSRDEQARTRLAERMREVLGERTPIELHARAWAAKGPRGATA